MKTIILTLTIFTFTSGANADVGWYINKGRAPGPTAEAGEPDIRMAAEAVDIVLHDDGVEVFGAFEFVNDSDETRTVEMYFPLNVGTLELTAETIELIASTDYYGEELTADNVTAKFRLRVNSSEAPYEVTDIYYDTDGEASELTGNAVWTVEFGPREKKTVECGYYCDYGTEYEFAGCREFFYVVSTGGAWKGPIGEGRITVRPCPHFDWEKPILVRGREMTPMGVYDDRIEWTFADFEPAEPEYETYTGLGDSSGIEIIVPWPRMLPEDIAAEYEGPTAYLRDEAVLLHKYIPGPEVIREEAVEIPPGSSFTLLKRKGEWFKVRYHEPGGPEEGHIGWIRWYEYDQVSGKENYAITGISVF